LRVGPKVTRPYIPRLLRERNLALHSFFVSVAAHMFSEFLGGIFSVNELGAEETGLDLSATNLPTFLLRPCTQSKTPDQSTENICILHIISFVHLVYIKLLIDNFTLI